jgi:hypothetical protein
MRLQPEWVRKVSSKTSAGSAPRVRRFVRGCVRHCGRVSKVAKEAMILFARAGAVTTVVLYVAGRDSADAQQALFVPLAIFWTVVAVTLTWTIDAFVRAVHAYLDRRP